MHACIHSCPFMHVHSYISMRTMRIYCLIFNYLFWAVWLSCSLQSPSWFVDDAFERWIKHTKLILWHDQFFRMFQRKMGFLFIDPNFPPLVGFFDRSFFCGTQFCLPGGHRQPVPEWYGSFPGGSTDPYTKVFCKIIDDFQIPDSCFLFFGRKTGFRPCQCKTILECCVSFQRPPLDFFRYNLPPPIHQSTLFSPKIHNQCRLSLPSASSSSWRFSVCNGWNNDD